MMLKKKIIVTVILFCSFFGIVQGRSYDAKQLQKFLGKPVHSFYQLSDFIMVDHWVYTTELSKILLVGEPQIIQKCRNLPVVGSCIVPIIGSICDNRFEDFVQNVGNSSQQQLREAIQDALLLATASSKSYLTSQLLHYLEQALKNKINFIQDQMKFNFQYDKESLSYLKKSCAWAGLITFILLTNKYITCNDENLGMKKNLDFLESLAVLGSVPVSYKILKNSYEVLTKDPNARNQYLKEYQDLLEFVQDLGSQLKTNGCIIFRLADGNVATVKEYGVSFL